MAKKQKGMKASVETWYVQAGESRTAPIKGGYADAVKAAFAMKASDPSNARIAVVRETVWAVY